MTACGYMNPEYEEDELEKALQWAVPMRPDFGVTPG
jgi:hypothetical protein